MGGTCSAYGGGERHIQGLVGKHEEKRPLGRPRRKWEDNIEMDLQEVDFGSMDWIELAQDRDRWRTVVNEVNPHNIRFTSRCKDSPLSIAVRVSVSQRRGQGQLSRYSESLQAVWSGDQIPMGTRNSTNVQTGPGARPTSIQWVPGLFPGVKVAGAWRGVQHPTESSAEVKERVQPYFSFPFGPSWPAIRRPLTYKRTLLVKWKKWNLTLV